MSSLEAYLDQACARLDTNPAEVADVRRELRSHLDERVLEAMAEGVSLAEAVEEVLLGFGGADEVRAGLRHVHHHPWWLSRVHSVAVGALLGAAITLLLSLAQHLGLSPVYGPAPAAGATIGAAIGLVSFPGRSPVAGLVVGSLGWTTACLATFLTASLASSSGDWLRPFNSLVLSPVLGSFFGVAVSAASAAVNSTSLGLRSGAS